MGRHLSQASGTEYRFVFAVRPGGEHICTARVYRDRHLVCVLARGLVERELNADDVTENIRSLVVSHIDSLG